MRRGPRLLEKEEVRCFFKEQGNYEPKFAMKGTEVPCYGDQGLVRVPVISAKIAEGQCYWELLRLAWTVVHYRLMISLRSRQLR